MLIRESKVSIHRKYLHKMDRQLLLIHLAMKYAMKYCYSIPNMEPDYAYEYNANIFADLYHLSNKTEHLRDATKTALLSKSNNLPLVCKIDQALLRLVRYIFFHKEGK